MEPSLLHTASSVTERVLTIGGFFIFGGFFPVLANVILTDEFEWKYGLMLTFQKPWFITWGMLFGLTLFLVPLMVVTRCFSKETTLSWQLFRACAIPGLCNLFVTLLTVHALAFLPPAIWKSIQIFGLIFTTLIKGGFGSRRSLLLDWTGLFIIFMGLLVSGTSALLQTQTLENHNPVAVLFSILLIIVAELVKSGQGRIEEIMLHEYGASTYAIIACEGVWGFFIATFVFMPFCSISDPSSGLIFYENTLGSIEMMTMSYRLPLLFAILVIVVTIYGYLGVLVIQETDARNKSTYDAVMPFVVWLFGVFSRWITKNSKVGESFDKYSLYIIIGFIISFCGTLIYFGGIKLPWITYLKDTDTIIAEEDDEYPIHP